jgi:hypothetical protein
MAAKLKTAVLGATGYSGLELARLLSPPSADRCSLAFAPERRDRRVEAAGSPRGLRQWQRPFTVAAIFMVRVAATWRRTAVSGHAARSFARTCSRSGSTRPANRRSQRSVAAQGPSESSRLRFQRRRRQNCGGTHRARRLRSARTEVECGPDSIGGSGCESWLLRDLGHSRAGALAVGGLVDSDRGIISDSKSGVSGAGKEPTARTHFVAVADNFSAYSVFGHRHTGEILEQLALNSSQLIFTPHLLPIPRGILSTIYVYLKREMTADEIQSCFQDFYRGKRWIRIFRQAVCRRSNPLCTPTTAISVSVSRAMDAGSSWSHVSTTCSKAQPDKPYRT